MCNKYGCGLVGIAGSILASVAVAASVYSPNIYVMWLLFGLFGGIGMGLVYLPSIVMVGYCFKDKRAIATGKIIQQFCFGQQIVEHSDRHRDCGDWHWFDHFWTTLNVFIQ